MTKPQTLYVRLLDEGTDVWRPVLAYCIEGDTYVLLRPADYDPQAEQWEFPPGTVVETQSKTFAGQSHLTATRAVRLMSQTA